MTEDEKRRIQQQLEQLAREEAERRQRRLNEALANNESDVPGKRTKVFSVDPWPDPPKDKKK